jgi:hypothetical protein
MRRIVPVTFGLLLAATAAWAQEELQIDKIRLGAPACVQQAGSGSPEGVVTGKICDTYLRSDGTTFGTVLYVKTTATGNTGWAVGGGVTGSGTQDYLPKWATTTSLGNSIIYETSGKLGISGTPQEKVQIVFAGAATEGTIGLSILSGVGDTELGFGANASLDHAWIQAFQDATSWTTRPLKLQPNGGDLHIDAGTTKTTDYASQTTGWAITEPGSGDFRSLYADELHAKSFIADLEQALAGGQIITKSVAVLTSFTCPALGATATLTVEDLPGAPDMQVFDVSDAVAARTFARASQSLTIGDCVGTVSAPDTSGSGTQSWTFTRGTGGNGGGMAVDTVVPAKTLVLDYGTSGAGYYEVNAIDGTDAINSPYAQVVTWATAPVAANRTVRARYGKLTGVTSNANEYGLLAGSWADKQYFRASNAAVELYGVNFSMFDGATEVFKIDRTAPSLALGGALPSAYGTGTGVWMGKDSGVYKFRVGNPAGSRVTWDGTDLNIVGSITATTGTIGGWVLGSDFFRDAAGVVGMWSAVTWRDDIRIWAGAADPPLAPFKVTESGLLTASLGVIGGWILGSDYLVSADSNVGMTSTVTGGDDIRFFAGHYTPTSAPFRVAESGALVASNATITGSVTATSGAIGGWVMGATYLVDAASAVGMTSAVTGGDDVRFFAGSATPANAPFRVTESGALTATSATLTGTVNATAGYFGDASTDVAIDASGIVVGSSGRVSAGGGAVTLDSSGVTIANGSSSYNKLKWDDGSVIGSSGDLLSIAADTSVYLYGSSVGLRAYNAAFEPTTSGAINLGGTSLRWNDFFIAGDIYWDSPPATGSADYPMVWSSSAKALYYKNDAASGTGCTVITAENGIVTSCSNEPSPLQTEVAALKADVATLKVQIATLMALLGSRH